MGILDTPIIAAHQTSPQVTGQHYMGLLVTQTRTLGVTLNRCYFTPAYTKYAITIDQLAVNVSATASNATYRMGIFLPASQSAPFALSALTPLVDGGTVDCASSTGVKSVTVSASVPAGSWFFLAGAAQTAAATMSVGGAAGLNGWSPMGGNSTAGGYTMGINVAMFADSVSGAFSGNITPGGYVTTDSGVTYRRAT